MRVHLLLLLLIVLSGCPASTPLDDAPPAETVEAVSPPTPAINAPSIPRVTAQAAIPTTLHFKSVAEERGIDFTYENGATGKLLMVESLGGGAAWLDYDRDGQLDLYLTQGGDPEATDLTTSRHLGARRLVKTTQNSPADQLYRQADLQFVEVHEQAGIVEQQYSQGVAVGDFDNDGFPDIYVTNCHENRFFWNLGDGTFVETAEAKGLDDRRWSSSAAWGDLDLDGDLDLYVCNYLQYDAYHPLKCEKDGRPALCHPRQIDAWPDECFENLGNGEFAPRSHDWKLQGPGNKGLGVILADLTNDGLPDVYVANDTTPNFFFIHQSDQHFEESALRMGVGLSGEGAMQASMGIAVGDYDRSGTLDLYLTHFTGESNTLYQNHGEFGFIDVSGLTGIYHATFPRLGFGTVMHDFDANGTQELISTNGHIDENNADFDGYEQRPQLLTYVNKRWLDCSTAAGDYFQQKFVGRGIARGDYDGDGDDDLMIVHQNAAAVLLENHSESGHWLRLYFRGRSVNRFGIGVRVSVNSEPAIYELVGGSSYCSTHEPALFLGLGEVAAPVELHVTWPGGKTHTVTVEQLNQVLTLTEP